MAYIAATAIHKVKTVGVSVRDHADAPFRVITLTITDVHGNTVELDLFTELGGLANLAGIATVVE